MPSASPEPFLPVNEPLLSAEARRLAIECLDSGWLSSAGPFVAKFEQAFAAYCGVRHGIAVTNGTSALHCALLSAGVGPGDEVIVPAFTMIATSFAVAYTGARPIFVDCEPETFNLDVAQLEQAVSPRTRAIIPVHLFGHACDMDAVRAVAQRHGLLVIEDAAQAHGARYKGRRCGGLGDVACFSFYANKIITTGEGGMIITDDADLAKRARGFRDLCHSEARRFIHVDLGYNFRMTNIQAAIGLGELGSIERYLERKRAMARRYGELLADVPGIRTPVTRPWADCVYWMYTITIDPTRFGMDKDALRARLREQGIDTRDVFYPPADQPALTRRFGDVGSFPVAEQAARSACYLPSGLALRDDQIDRVAAAIRKMVR